MPSDTPSIESLRKWLGSKTDPPSLSHYDLIGVSIDEEDPSVIRAGFQAQKAFVSSQKAKIKTNVAKEVLRRLSKAENTLLDPQLREQYDRENSLFEKRSRKRQGKPSLVVAALKAVGPPIVRVLLQKQKRNFGIAGLSVLASTLITLLFLSPDGTKSSIPDLGFTDFDVRIRALETRRSQLLPLLETAESDRAEIVEKLRDSGVSGGSDLRDNPIAQRLASTLQTVVRDIQRLRFEIEKLDEAVIHVNTLKRRAEQEALGITDEELASLSVDTKGDGSALSGDPVSLDDLLAQELGGRRTTQTRSDEEEDWRVRNGDADPSSDVTATTSGKPNESDAEPPSSSIQEFPPPIPAEDEWTYLASLPLVSARSQFGRWSDKGQAVLGGQDGRALVAKPLIFNGRHSTHGIYLHPLSYKYSHVTYELRGRFSQFRADAFVPVMSDHQGEPATPLVFRVVGDGRVLWESKPMASKEHQEGCAVSVSGIDNLTLEIGCPGPNSWCLGAWAEPRLKAGGWSPDGTVVTGNVALSSRGATVNTDIRNPWAINDGKISDSWREYAKASLNKPIVVTLESVYHVQSIRVQLVGNDGYRYLLEVSRDGNTYETVQDRRHSGSWSGWQTSSFAPRPIRAIRLTGTYDAPNQTGIRVGEIEAYCTD